MNRRRAIAAAGLGSAAALLTISSHAQPEDHVTEDSRAAVDRGLQWLAANQRASGAWHDAQGPNLGVTSLAALALMAGGHQPGRGLHGRCVSRAFDFVLRRGDAEPPGYLHAGAAVDNHGQMYEHGFGALFLAELSGMLPNPARQRQLRELLDKAIAVTLNSQNAQGGWRYLPRVGDADISVTVAQLMALRAARNAGVYVPKGAVEKAVDYIKACQFPEGGFRYIKGVDAGGPAFARSAAAVVGLFCAGLYSDPAAAKGLAYLRQFRPSAASRQRDLRTERYYYYGHYYAALAMWTAGSDDWNDWAPAIRDELLARAGQTPGGIWYDFNHGPAFATAAACIILQLSNNALPILQK